MALVTHDDGLRAAIAPKVTPVIAASGTGPISPRDDGVWRLSPAGWASMLGALALIGFMSFDSLRYMVNQWSSKEEYGYAYILPFVIAFMIW